MTTIDTAPSLNTDTPALHALAQGIHNLFTTAHDGKTDVGTPLTPWDELPDDVRSEWLAAARAIRRAMFATTQASIEKQIMPRA